MLLALPLAASYLPSFPSGGTTYFKQQKEPAITTSTPTSTSGPTSSPTSSSTSAFTSVHATCRPHHPPPRRTTTTTMLLVTLVVLLSTLATAERNRHQAFARAKTRLSSSSSWSSAALLADAPGEASTKASNGTSSALLTVRASGRSFESLAAAAKVLSYDEMTALVGCRCKGMDFEPQQKMTDGFCNCLNQASHEPCSPAQDKSVKVTDHTTVQAPQADTEKDMCGWSQFYTDRFLFNKPFSVARYNDGEWLAMELGENGEGQSICPGNIDLFPCGASFTKRLRATLDKRELLDSTWSAGASASSSHNIPDFDGTDFIFQSSWDFTRHDQLLHPKNAWNFKQEFWLNDIIHGLVREHPADLTSWMLVLGDKNRFTVMGVGPKWLHNMAPKIPYGDFVEIYPEQSSANEVDKTIDTLEAAIGKELGVGLGLGAGDLSNSNLKSKTGDGEQSLATVEVVDSKSNSRQKGDSNSNVKSDKARIDQNKQDAVVASNSLQKSDKVGVDAMRLQQEQEKEKQEAEGEKEDREDEEDEDDELDQNSGEALLQILERSGEAQAAGKTFVCLLSASMMSNVIISDLFPEAKRRGAYLIDIGSGFDPLINAEGIHRRTGTDAQELYKNPSQEEVHRLVNLMAKIDGSYQQQGLGKPYFLSKPWKEMTNDEKQTLARKHIQAWVQ